MGIPPRSPLLGYNHNVRYRGRVFHVQTEDSGPANPHISTHLYFEGTILGSKRQAYDAALSDLIVRGLMQGLHKAILKELKQAQHDDKLAAFFEGRGEPFDDAPRPSVLDHAALDLDALPAVEPPPMCPPEVMEISVLPGGTVRAIVDEDMVTSPFEIVEAAPGETVTTAVGVVMTVAEFDPTLPTLPTLPTQATLPTRPPVPQAPPVPIPPPVRSQPSVSSVPRGPSSAAISAAPTGSPTPRPGPPPIPRGTLTPGVERNRRARPDQTGVASGPPVVSVSRNVIVGGTPQPPPPAHNRPVRRPAQPLPPPRPMAPSPLSPGIAPRTSSVPPVSPAPDLGGDKSLDQVILAYLSQGDPKTR